MNKKLTLPPVKGLSAEVIYKLTEIKTDECCVNFDYCLKHMIKMRPSTRDEFEEVIEAFLATAYFEDFFGLYGGLIPHRECARNLDEVRSDEAEVESRKKENLN